MEKFNFFCPLEIEEIEKSNKKNNPDADIYVAGLASDNSEDRQGEILEPSGFDISDFLKSGYINLEHYTTRKGDASYWIGEPVEAKVEGNKFFVKARLWGAHPIVKGIKQTVEAMQKSGSKRRPGFSIEGIPIERDPMNKKRITKAKITNLAFTMSPVNANTYADIVKGVQKEDFVKSDLGDVNGGVYLLKIDLEDGKVLTIGKDFSVKIENKAMDLESIKPLIKESLKRGVLDVTSATTIMKSIKEGILKGDNLKKFISILVGKMKK